MFACEIYPCLSVMSATRIVIIFLLVLSVKYFVFRYSLEIMSPPGFFSSMLLTNCGKCFNVKLMYDVNATLPLVEELTVDYNSNYTSSFT